MFAAVLSVVLFTRCLAYMLYNRRQPQLPCRLILHPVRPGFLRVPADLPIRGVNISKQRGGYHDAYGITRRQME